MRLESNGLKRVLILLFSLMPASLVLLSCGATPSAGNQTSGLKYRALISNNVSAGTLGAGVYILDAQLDVRANVASISSGNNPGMMVVAPNLAQTLVFSGSGTLGSDNQLTFVNNASESAAGHVTLPGLTESILISPDSSAAYAAVPTAPVIGQSPGVVEAMSMGNTSFTGQVNIPSVHYLSMDHGGNRILGFSDNSDSVAVITPSQIGIGNAVSFIGGFDRPVAAFFSSDDNTAYVVNCGAECGGVTASVQQVDLTTGTLGSYVAACTPGTTQCAGSVALVNGSTMYLAGTPYTAGGGPSLTCPTGTTQAQFCGQLTIVDLGQMSVVNTATIYITDGYHNRIAMGANGQLYVGARTCTEIVPPIPTPPGAEIRGCLSVYNTLSTAVGSLAGGAVMIPPENGDVTGLEPIGTRSVVYVVQGGSLWIYDDTTDALYNNPNDANNPGKIRNLVGDFIDVKTIDF